MRNIGIILSAVVFVFMSACSSQKFHTTRIESKNFEEYKTYAWLTPIDSLSKDYYNNDIAKDKILSTANNELNSRGLSYSKENPDILFRYIALVNNKSKLIYSNSYGYWGSPFGFYRPWGYYGFGYGMGYSYPVGKERVRYSHIIIEAIDTKSNTVVWQARGSQEVNVPERAINNLPNIISGILRQYPINVSKK